MKKFGEYITEGAPEGKKPEEVLGNKKSKIAEERLRLINERMGVGKKVKKMPATRPVVGLRDRIKQGFKTYAADVGTEARKNLGMGLGLSLAGRIDRITRRKQYIQPQFQQSQMPGGEKLQPRSSGGY